MIITIDHELHGWARWRHVGQSSGESSPIHRMMREHAPTNRKLHRRRRPKINLGTEKSPIYIERDTDPVHATETRPAWSGIEPRHREAELMDQAVAALRWRYRQIVEYHYTSPFSIEEICLRARCARSAYYLYLGIAHDCILAWLQGKREDAAAAGIIARALNELDSPDLTG